MGLKGSVGANKASGSRSENFPNDVLCVRNLLNIHIKHDLYFTKENFRQLPINGTHDMGETIRAIKMFQMHVLKIQRPTGRVDPGDATLKALVLGEVPGQLTEPLAPIADQIHNQLIRAFHYDYWGLLGLAEGLEGEIKSMIKLLLYDPEVNDSYIRDRYFVGESPTKDPRLENYIKEADPNTVPPFVNTITCSVRGLMKTEDGKRKYKSIDEVVRFLARVSDEMYVAYCQFYEYEKDTLYQDPSIYGQKAAATNVKVWFKIRFADPHSIYHCFPSLDLPSPWFYGPSILQF